MLRRTVIEIHFPAKKKTTSIWYHAVTKECHLMLGDKTIPPHTFTTPPSTLREIQSGDRRHLQTQKLHRHSEP